MLILDLSPSVGDKSVICEADIVLGSFGKWKPVELGYGGFVAANKDRLFDVDKYLFKIFKFTEDYNLLLNKLNNASKNIGD